MNSLLKCRPWKRVLSKCIQTSQFASVHSSPVYELRTYGVEPQHMSRFLELGAAHMHLRCAHSELLGYWVSEVGGGISDVCHIWKYDDLAHRARVRKALARDAAWMGEYLSKILPMLRFQKNSLLTLAPHSPLVTQVSPGGVYELQVLSKTDWLPETHAGEPSTLLARFFTIIGPTNTEVRVWHHADLEAAVDFASRNFENFKTDGHSRLLLPVSWSPWK